MKESNKEEVKTEKSFYSEYEKKMGLQKKEGTKIVKKGDDEPLIVKEKEYPNGTLDKYTQVTRSSTLARTLLIGFYTLLVLLVGLTIYLLVSS